MLTAAFMVCFCPCKLILTETMGVSVLIPMHTPDCHPGTNHQSLGSNQAPDCIVPESNSAQCSLPCTLTRMQYAPSKTVSRGRWATTWTNCPTSMSGALAAEVAHLSALPTLPAVHWAWTVTEPGTGGGENGVRCQAELALAPGRGNGPQMRGKLSPWMPWL